MLVKKVLVKIAINFLTLAEWHRSLEIWLIENVPSEITHLKSGNLSGP